MRSLNELRERTKDTLVFLITYLHPALTTVEDRGTEWLPDGTQVKIHWYEEDSSLLGVNLLVLDSILLNRRVYRELSTKSQELILRHELSHRNRHGTLRGLWLGIILWGIGGIWILWRVLITGGSPSHILSAVGLAAVTTTLAVLAIRIEETVADLQALHALGKDDFLDAYEEVRETSTEISGTSRLGEVQRAILYSDPDDTVRIYNTLFRFHWWLSSRLTEN